MFNNAGSYLSREDKRGSDPQGAQPEHTDTVESEGIGVSSDDRTDGTTRDQIEKKSIVLLGFVFWLIVGGAVATMVVILRQDGGEKGDDGSGSNLLVNGESGSGSNLMGSAEDGSGSGFRVPSSTPSTATRPALTLRPAQGPTIGAATPWPTPAPTSSPTPSPTPRPTLRPTPGPTFGAPGSSCSDSLQCASGSCGLRIGDNQRVCCAESERYNVDYCLAGLDEKCDSGYDSSCKEGSCAWDDYNHGTYYKCCLGAYTSGFYQYCN